MNTLDLIVFAVIAVSGLLAFVRGFVREVLAVAAWVGAVFAAIYLTPAAAPMFHQMISAQWLADIVTPVVIFIVALLLLSMITGIASSRVRNSGMGAADRALGLLFGVARGFIIVCLAYLAMNYFIPPTSRPAWIAEARSLPLLAKGANEMVALVPNSLIAKSTNALKDAQRKAEGARQIKQGLDTLQEPDRSKQPAQNNGTGNGATPPGNSTQPATPNQNGSNATPPADYSDADRNGMNQLLKGAQ
ncbi:MAG TPA: CvpA family protein [Stellaceae bacterium]|nr:CvpA family protein [Stellaceae bacterium]